MSIRWRILGAFLLIILLAVSLSVVVEYYATQGQLDAFVKELGQVEANNLARDLSRAYTSSGGWAAVETALSEGGYLYSEGLEHDGFGEGEGENEGGEENSESFHIDRIRVVIVDFSYRVVYDNYSLHDLGDAAPVFGGYRTTIIDLRTEKPVGYAYVDVNREFLSTESSGFLRSLLISSAIGGLLITGIALGLATWLSRRITAPIAALTEATREIAERGDATQLPVNSDDELGQMSESFNQMTTALLTQRDLRKRLIDDVTHELNTPLSVIQLEAHGLRNGLQTPTHGAENIIQEVSTLRGLVHDLNWLAETDSGEQRISIEPCSIRQLLTDEVERWLPQAQMQRVSLSLVNPPELPMLDLDQMRMSQALGNVLQNAFQHTEAGGHIAVAAKMEEDDVVMISITDDGAGIDAADLPHVFDRFYRNDDSRNRSTGGMGLGLAIARAIIEAHNGTISVVSDGLGEGTSVRFELPMR